MMRSQDEVQRAHDLLREIIMQEVPITLAPEERPAMHSALDVLCWVLGHEHSRSFALNLEPLEQHLKDQGYWLEKKEGP